MSHAIEAKGNFIRHGIMLRGGAGLIAGLIGGGLFTIAVGTLFNPITHLLISALLGIIFGVWIGPRLDNGGASLVWGEAYGLLWWLFGYLTLVPLVLGEGLYWSPEEIQFLFPLLLGQVIAFGAALGLSYFGLIQLAGRFLHVEPAPSTPAHFPGRPHGQEILAPRWRGMLLGGIGGLIGGWVFLFGIERANFFPLIANLVGSDANEIGRLLHYLIALVIGITFGLLFHRALPGIGFGIVRGMTYGISWWMLGPMTLRPILVGSLPDWSLVAAHNAFTPLISHILYGAIVGFFFAAANKLWNTLFVDSDPLNRTRESAGTRSLRGILMGQAAGIIGGLLYTIVTISVDSLPAIATLVGGSSRLTGFLVHLLIAILIGSTYGLFFHNAAYGYGSGMGWGLCYGFLWWILGTNTLFLVLLRQPVDWSLAAAVARYPALVGHLLYGMGLGLFFQYLVQRYDKHPLGRDGNPHIHRTAGSPAAALWAVVLLIGTMLPILLGT